jgi:integrase
MNETSATPIVHPLWTNQFARALKSKNPSKANAYNIFVERLSKEAPLILQGQAEIHMRTEESDKLLSNLEKKLPLVQQKIIQNAFRDGLSEGNAENRWEIYLPPPRLLPFHHPNLVKPQHFVLQHDFQNIQAIFLDRFEDLWDSPVEVKRGALIFSAAAFDGIGNKAKLEAISRLEQQQIILSEHLCMIGLFESGIWFPGGISQALLICAQAHRDNKDHESAVTGQKSGSMHDQLSALAEFLKLNSRQKQLLCKRLPTLNRAHHADYMPGYLLAYNHGMSESTPLPVSGYQLLMTGSPGISVSSEYQKPRKSIQKAERDDKKDQRASLMQLGRRILEGLTEHPPKSTPEEATLQLQSLLADESLWPVQRLLIEWLCHEIAEITRKKKRISSLIKYYQSIWRSLLMTLAFIDPFVLDQRAQEDWLSDALMGDRSVSGQLDFQAGLSIFMTYMFNQRGLAKCDLNSVEGWILDAKRPVNADWLTPKQFDAVINLISSGQVTKESWLKEVSVLIARLCYRSGTRRTEPTVIRVMDLQVSKTPELIVRESQFGTLKSNQGERRIPIHGLFPVDEANALLDYAQRRLDVSGPRAPLFVNPEKPDVALIPDSVFRVITRAMKMVTGRDLVAHTLRHSAANTLLIQLEVADGNIELPNDIDVFQHLNFSKERCIAVKNAIFRRLADSPEDSGEKNIYALCLIIGHLSPKTTIKSYLHLFDLLTFINAKYMQPRIQCIPFLAKLMGLSVSGLYDFAKRHGIRACDLNLERLISFIRSRTESLRCV